MDIARLEALPGALPGALPALLLVALVVGVSACDSTDLAMGEVNDIYVVTTPEVWSAIEDTVETALQPTIQTVARDRTYHVVHLDPGAEGWARQRRLRNILLIGTPDQGHMQTALEKAGDRSVEPPAMFSLRDLWARNQRVSVLVVESTSDIGEIESRLPALREHYDAIFREWAMARMWASGRDTALAGSLARDAGFSLLVPDVYLWDRQDSIYVFRNDQPSPDELIRQIHVTWMSPVPADLDPLFSREGMIEWRQEVGAEAMNIPQIVDTLLIREGPIDFRGHPAYEVRATWKNPPEADWPAGGPFITRAVVCRDQARVYLVDAWLYAPDRDKYEYMLQLETILASFRCDGRPATLPEEAARVMRER